MPYTFERSKAMFDRAGKSIAGGINSGIRKMEEPVPLYFTHGKGAHLYDVDGNEYIDFQIGQGAILFGHAPEGLAAALAKQASLGTHWAAQSELEIEVAERVQAMVPSAERMRCSNSATEAVMAALRLARAKTGRSKILRFEGHYHGWSDEGLAGFATPPAEWDDGGHPRARHPSGGVIPAVLDTVVVGYWNDPAHLRTLVAESADELAAIIFEPCLCNTSCIEPVPGMIETIRELCDQYGIVMIADETITGLRFGAGSAQGYYGFTPDLTIFGKAIGGGVPFAVLAGKASAMEPITLGKAVHAGTLNGNPLCLAAAKWCLDQVAGQGPSHPETINLLGRRLMTGLRNLADRNGIPLRPQGPGLVFFSTMLKAGAEDEPVRNYREHAVRHDQARWAHLRRCLLEEGVRAIERGIWMISFATTDALVDEALKRASRAFVRHAAEWPVS
ncbi:MAG: aspartate aminotransferase family protein [Opitutaceae bacterium]